MDTATLALPNLLFQSALLALVVVSGYLSRARKKHLRLHCTLIRVAGGGLILSAIVVMVPSFWNYQPGKAPLSWFTVEVMVHAALGLALLGLWVYVNLVMMRLLPRKGRLRNHMRVASGLWVGVFLIGVHIYARIWLGL